MPPKPLIEVLNAPPCPGRDLRGADAAGVDARRGGVLDAPVGAVGVGDVVEGRDRSRKRHREKDQCSAGLQACLACQTYIPSASAFNWTDGVSLVHEIGIIGLAVMVCQATIRAQSFGSTSWMSICLIPQLIVET